ncbi:MULTISPECIES: DUF1127 domain-containing protein [Rhodobacter]|uniref:Uncharacterized protein YjiS n=2 Tax=Rhodobacter TaxID=1060 RepID=A0A285RKW8_9RHOB|nr:DUF1127 domain-containing protein [Rhodobacter maris]SOB94368.1 uncharacterized protein YjiS [Rhodobacter maris]
MSALDSYRFSARNARAGLFNRVLETFVVWNEARLTRRALEQLSDRELNDIGLSRFDIDRIGR